MKKYSNHRAAFRGGPFLMLFGMRKMFFWLPMLTLTIEALQVIDLRLA
jgi:hypothetical protein